MSASETTQEGLPVEERRGEGGGRPTLILAFTDGIGRAPERRVLPAGGILLGRDALIFPGGRLDDSRLSRRHAEVRYERGGPVLRDLESRNGTWVNGRRVVAPHPLSDGDVIRIGATLLLFARTAEPDRSVAESSPLVGTSFAMESVRRAISAVAGKRRIVLITGETGTGKELVAAALHQESRRAGRFVAVNCGALSEGTLESELFGHRRGAFTGAGADRPGLFRAADGGTLFLDEIGEMVPALQVKLLRTLETHAVRPVGDTRDVAVDVTVAAATNRDLAAEVRASRFRADLYGRLAQWIIHLPPLRERREDIPSLIAHLLGRCDGEGRPLTVALAEALLTHPWPLNVRGLLNALSATVLACPKSGPLDLRPEVAAVLEANRAILPPPSGDEAPVGEPAREQVEAALARFQGRVAQAARHLGCSRQQLYRWARKHGLDPRQFRPL